MRSQRSLGALRNELRVAVDCGVFKDDEAKGLSREWRRYVRRGDMTVPEALGQLRALAEPARASLLAPTPSVTRKPGRMFAAVEVEPAHGHGSTLFDWPQDGGGADRIALRRAAPFEGRLGAIERKVLAVLAKAGLTEHVERYRSGAWLMQATPPQPSGKITAEVADAYVALPRLARVRDKLRRGEAITPDFAEDMLYLGNLEMRLDLWPTKKKRERSDKNLSRRPEREGLFIERDEKLRRWAEKLRAQGHSKRRVARALAERFGLSQERVRKII